MEIKNGFTVGQGWKPTRPSAATRLGGWNCFVWLAAMAGAGLAQDIVPLVQFTNVWRYEVSGADLGTNWRGADYDDSRWSAGPGLFQAGETTPYPAPFGTILPPAGTIITRYFRTGFEVPAGLVGKAGVELVATNLVDDGCVLYLNGTEVGRVRMPPGFNFQTLASAGPTMEGQFDLLAASGTLLQPGWNVLCAEVHQNSSASADVVWGTRLVAQVPRPLVMVRPPVGSTNMVGDAIELSAEVAGAPVVFRWWKDGVLLPGATNASLALTSVPASSGAYMLMASNVLNVVTSATVQVLVLPDRSGPRVLSATVGISPFSSTNSIDLVFNESVMGSSAQLTNFSLIRMRNGAPVSLTNVSTSGRTVRLRVTPAAEDWVYFDDYFVQITGIRDTLGNVIAPGTRVAVGWPRYTNVLHPASVWRFHNSAVFDPGVYDQDWTGTNYTQLGWWGTGSGPFYHFSAGFDSCLGWVGPDGWGDPPPGTEIGFQPEPFLFRTTFQWLASLPPNATLRPWFLVDDGAVMFVNGQEVYRYNTPTGRVTAATRATTTISQPTCVTNIGIAVTNLLAGTNWLAIAITQVGDGDVGFALSLPIDYLQTPMLPPEPAPTVRVSAEAGGYQLSWAPGGYALESAATLDHPLSYPQGPWTEVSNMANPFTLPTTNDWTRFYRLKQK